MEEGVEEKGRWKMRNINRDAQRPNGYDSKKPCLYMCTLSLAKFLQGGDHHGIAVPSCTRLRIPTRTSRAARDDATAQAQLP